MRNLNVRSERGVTTVMFALMFTTLIAAAGLGIHSSSLAFERSRIQHSADAAALAIAFDCASNEPCNTPAALITAGDFTTKNSSGGTATIPTPNPLAKASGTVTVDILKSDATDFFASLNIFNINVDASATAIWTHNPVSADILPFATSLCEYVRSGINTPTVIRNDMNDGAKDTIVPNGKTLATEAYTNMSADTANPLDPYVGPSCTVPGDVTLPGSPTSVTMLKGGLWLSDAGNSLCNGKVLPTDVLQSLNSVTSYNETCAAKFSSYLASEKILLMGLYAPTDNYDHAGLRLNGLKAQHPAEFSMRLVGYAPFKLTGWCFSKKDAPVDCGGASPGTPGFAGMFLSTAVSDPSYEYGEAGGDFGAYGVELVK